MIRRLRFYCALEWGNYLQCSTIFVASMADIATLDAKDDITRFKRAGSHHNWLKTEPWTRIPPGSSLHPWGRLAEQR